MAAIVNLKQECKVIQVDFMQNRPEPKEKPILPRKSAHGAVDPIKDLTDLQLLKDYFLNKNRNVRNYTLLVVGVNVGLRVSDLTQLKLCDFLAEDGTFYDKIYNLKEKKTGKLRYIVINQSIRDAITLWMAAYKDAPRDAFLFFSTNYSTPLTPNGVWKVLHRAGEALGFTFPLGTHSLRKTWARHFYFKYNESPQALVYLQTVLGHANQRDTLRYIGVSVDEVDEMLMELNL